MEKLVMAIAIAAVSMGAGAWWWRARDGVALALTTAPIQRGDLAATISATGTIEPVEVVMNKQPS